MTPALVAFLLSIGCSGMNARANDTHLSMWVCPPVQQPAAPVQPRPEERPT
jgi:hypothetical protein